MTARAIQSVVRTVPDLAVAEAFYAGPLGFAVVDREARIPPGDAEALGDRAARVRRTVLLLGEQRLILVAFDPPGPSPEATASDFWFQHCAIVVRDIDAAVAGLRGTTAMALSQGGPQHLPPNTGSVAAYKFRDPAGLPLEFLWFPPETAPEPWASNRSSALCLGIDHTAIVVSDVGASQAFYGSRFGLRRTAHSANAGPAQSRLDAIGDDHVEVVALGPMQGTPHLELLGYRAGLRRPDPPSVLAADAGISRTVFAMADAEGRSGRSVDSHGTWMGQPAAALCDPDGHRMIVCHSAS